MEKQKQHKRKLTVRVTAQTAFNPERLMQISGQKTPAAVTYFRPNRVFMSRHTDHGTKKNLSLIPAHTAATAPRAA